MSKIDLSKFRQTYVKDTVEDLKEIAAMKQVQRIPEGIHEVVVSEIHEKEGAKCKLVDKLGGSIGFSLVFKDAIKQEQMVYFIVPLAVTFRQACMDKEKGISFMFKKCINNLQIMGIDPILFREAILASDSEAIECLVGTQCVIINSWPTNKVHLEYDSIDKANYFVTSSGERFSTGEMAGGIVLPADVKDNKIRFAEVHAVCLRNGYKFAEQMDTQFDVHPTASNDKINEALSKLVQPKKQVVVNKTIPAFPIKRTVAPLSVEPDMDIPE